MTDFNGNFSYDIVTRSDGYYAAVAGIPDAEREWLGPFDTEVEAGQAMSAVLETILADAARIALGLN